MTLRPQRQSSVVDADMTPMIDVVLQLILFFMYTAQYAQVVRTPMELPTEPGERIVGVDRSAVVVEVLASGQIIVDQQHRTLEQLTRLLEIEISSLGSADALEVVLRADRATPAAHVNAIATALSSLGVRAWSIATLEAGPIGGAP